MGEKTILVCDVCGRPAVETATIKIGRRNLVKDLCASHVAEITAGARRPRPGRRRGTVAASAAAPKRRGRPRKTAVAAPKKRGRPRKKSA
ncbi:MAG: hypothetical protein ACT4PO_10535 [Actinomycetota bacterium]